MKQTGWLAFALIFLALPAVPLAEDLNGQGTDGNANPTIPPINFDINIGEVGEPGIEADINLDLNLGIGADVNYGLDLNGGTDANGELNNDTNSDGNLGDDTNEIIDDSNGNDSANSDANDGTAPINDEFLPIDQNGLFDINGIIDDVNKFIGDVIDSVHDIVDPIVDAIIGDEGITSTIIRQSNVNIGGIEAKCIGIKCHGLAYETGGSIDDIVIIGRSGGRGVNGDDASSIVRDINGTDLNSGIGDLNDGSGFDLNSVDDSN